MGPKPSSVERLSAIAAEANIRVILPNDYLFKVDTASMKEALEVRVPLLDEDLFDFALTLPHRLKVHRSKCKRLLRAVARRRLPPEIAAKKKAGFALPVDSWVDGDFRVRLRERLLRPQSILADVFHRETYAGWVESFCDPRPRSDVSREGLYRRVILLLAVVLAAERGVWSGFEKELPRLSLSA